MWQWYHCIFDDPGWLSNAKMCKPRKRRNCSNALFVEQCYIDFIVKHNNLYRHWNEKKNLFVQAYQSCELLAWICRVLPNGEEFLKSKKEALVTMCEDCSKVEKILKCNLDSLPQRKFKSWGGGKFAWGVKVAGCRQQIFENNTQQC